jgi:molecular chaperone DnaJ
MGAKQKNFYEILGLSANVSSLEIKRAYRELVKCMHPDVDYKGQTHRQRSTNTERMMRLNEAYETLKDRSKRAAYDSIIGVNGRGNIHGVHLVDDNDTDYARQQYLTRVFYPTRQGIGKLLNKYKQQLAELSQDIYDDVLVENFEQYANDLEEALRNGSHLLSSVETPKSLRPAELMMRFAIAQAADGLEELRRYFQNYNYDHLSMGGNLFREYTDLSKKALQLSKQ